MPASCRGRKRPLFRPYPRDRQKIPGQGRRGLIRNALPAAATLFPRHDPSGNTLPLPQTARRTCPGRPPLRRAPPFFRAQAPFSCRRSPANAPSRRKKASRPPDFRPERPSGSASALFRGAPLSGRTLPCPAGSEIPAAGFRLLFPPRLREKIAKTALKNCLFFSFSGRKRRCSAVSGASSAFRGRHLREYCAFSGPPFPSGRKSVSFFLPP